MTPSSLNESLWHAIGAAISTEARALNNVGQAGLTFWAPNLNLFRDPRWGRGQETAGEDPHLSGRYAVAYTRGMQQGADAAHLKVSSCCKHWAAYSLEDSDGATRTDFDARVSAYDMHQSYAPAFEACVRDGGASCVMCSYNAINGVTSAGTCTSGRGEADFGRGGRFSGAHVRRPRPAERHRA